MIQAFFYCLQVAVALALPIFCFRKFNKNTKGKNRSFSHGIYVYLIFTALLNSVVQVIIETSLPIDSSLLINPWASAIFGGVVLTVFVSLGRIIWIKGVMKKEREKNDGLVFGAGYALAMNAVTYGLSGIVSVVFSVMNALDSTSAVPSVFETTAKIVANGSSYTVFLITLQAIILCVLEISLSAIFFTSLKQLSNSALVLPAILASAAAYTFLEAPLSLEIRLIIVAVITLLISGLCWYCIKKEQ